MIRKFLLPLVALVGVLFAVYVAVKGGRTLPPAPPVSDAPQPPYDSFVAGSGLIEANTENIAIGTPIAGLVSCLDVRIGSEVKAGDSLFTIDDRAQAALVAVKRAAALVAEAQLNQAQYEEKVGLAQKNVLSSEDLETRHHAVQIAEAQLVQFEAEVLAASTDLDRLTVRAPVDGEVLQMKLHPGEFAPTGVLPQPLLLLGGTKPMNVRVDVDENDAWRVPAGAVATGYLRGNKDIHVQLKFVRFEPFVIPKTSLTGESTERVDTRVLQVVFSFDRGDQPIYIGQQMDVFIDASKPLPAPGKIVGFLPSRD